MGHKVNPHGMRVGVIEKWNTQWYADKKDFSVYLLEDYKIRQYIENKYKTCGISRVIIERPQNKIQVSVYTSKPGVIIGQKHVGVDELKAALEKIVGEDKRVFVNIIEVKQVDMDAKLVAENIAAQLEKRAFFRRAMKQAMNKVMHAGAKGVKVQASGRIEGAEIARSETFRDGSIPLQTLRANINYGFAEAHTTFGIIGIKVWIYKGEVLQGTVKKEGE